MISERKGVAVLARAPAKVNLFLEVLRKRPDGYHEIATLMVAVSLYDTLEFTEEESGRLELTCDEPSLSCGPDNLVWRAAELLRQRYGVSRGARIRLTKRIPLAAGLAGGSSDAAATLAGLNRLWDLGLSRPELATRAAELGSDVAFFFATPAAWCTGRGEIVTPTPLGKPLHLLLACPDAGLATADVYRGVTLPDKPLDGQAIRQALAGGDLREVGRELYNRLQPAAEKLCPEVVETYARLGKGGALGRLMSGSGTSVFALCAGRREAVDSARRLRELERQKRPGPAGRGLRLFLVRSCV
jgi:4-diphosphocytidyl-2-C-methyl-D-erythritol kinase